MTRLIALLLLVLAPKISGAYAILTHEAVVDSAWEKGIAPLLAKRFPGSTPEQIMKARAFAYGGAIMPDMGYFPFGSRFFTHLVHYARTGTFVKNLISEARDLNEYAFALGALAHYNADNHGHPEGVNPTVALVYPDAKEEYGDTITYEECPIAHKRLEFGFDVLQVSRGNYADSNYVHLTGFEVSKTVLERAFEKTYGLKLTSVFANVDLAIATFRWSVKDLFPLLTDAAWVTKKNEIQKKHPGMTRKEYRYKVNRQQYIKTWDKVPLKVRAFSLVLRIIPKFGLARALRFKVPDAEAEKRFDESFASVVGHYIEALNSISAGGQLVLPDRNFDTGRLSRAGEYFIADETYDELLKKLAGEEFRDIDPGLEKDILAYYSATKANTIADLYTKKFGKTAQKGLAGASTDR